jgi:hypothetical protein
VMASMQKTCGHGDQVIFKKSTKNITALKSKFAINFDLPIVNICDLNIDLKSTFAFLTLSSKETFKH